MENDRRLTLIQRDADIAFVAIPKRALNYKFRVWETAFQHGFHWRRAVYLARAVLPAHILCDGVKHTVGGSGGEATNDAWIFVNPRLRYMI